jgi:hypothetical protein
MGIVEDLLKLRQQPKTPIGDTTGQVGFNALSNQWEYVIVLPSGKMAFTGVKAPEPFGSANISAGASAYAANVAAATAAAARQQEAEQWQKSFDYKIKQDDIANKNVSRQISQKDRELANSERAQSFLEYKGAFEQAQGLTSDYNATQQRAFENAAKINDMRFQRDSLQAQLNTQVAIQNQNNQLAVQQATAQFEANRQDRLAALSRDIGTLAADPGSRAKLASTLLANSGWGRANTALAKGDQITEESLQPLAQDLGLREEIRAQRSPFTYTPINAPVIPQITEMATPEFRTTKPPAQFAPTTTAPATGSTSPFTPTNVGALSGQQGTAAQNAAVAALQAQGFTMAPSTPAASSGGGGSGGMAKGGMTTEEQFIVGDRRDGKPAGTEELIINPTKAPIKVVPNNELPKYFGGTMPARYADGTDNQPSKEWLETYYRMVRHLGNQNPLYQIANLGGGMEQANLPVGGAYYQGVPIAGAWGSVGAAPAPETGMRLPNTVIPNYNVPTPVDYGDYNVPVPPGYGDYNVPVPPGYGDYNVPVPANYGGSYYNGVWVSNEEKARKQKEAEEWPRNHPYLNALGSTLDAISNFQQEAANNPLTWAFPPGAFVGPASGAGAYAMGRLGEYIPQVFSGMMNVGTRIPTYIPKPVMEKLPSVPLNEASELLNSMGLGRIPGYAEGTEGSVFGEIPLQDTTEARNFLTKSLQNALSGTPWTAANLPSAVYASTPGTDPVVAQLLGALNAQARGVPAETFLRQASLLAPSGATQSVTRRSA